jgi:hypothetical protein
MAIITRTRVIAATLSISMDEKLSRFVGPVCSVIFRPLCKRAQYSKLGPFWLAKGD